MSRNENTATVEGTTTEDAKATLITAGLLSWAKDVRYVQEFQRLLKDAGESLVGRRLRRSLVDKGSWYASLLVYLIFVLRPHGRTLGMLTSGLEFQSSSGQKLERHTVLVTVLAFLVGAGGLDWWTTLKSNESDEELNDLRGDDRRQRYQTLRQQMFERASGGSMSSAQPSSSLSLQGEELEWHEKAANQVQSALKSFFGELCFHGPHLLQPMDGSRAETLSVVGWVTKLHLAQFLVTGKFPTVLHRVLGIGYQLDGEGHRILAKPNTQRVIAMLIAIQASSSLVRYALRKWTEYVADYLEKRTRESEKKSRQLLPSPETLANASCAICLMPRTHPTVIRTCGHVFCWKCVNHWATAVKLACPFCRIPCEEADIQPLFGYDTFSDNAKKDV